MTDALWLLSVLKDGCWHSRDAILSRSFSERGCGLTVHSRVSDLRKNGHRIECKTRLGSEGQFGQRRSSFYRMVNP